MSHYMINIGDLEGAVHPSTTGIMVFNVPGAHGSLDGFNNKFVKIGNLIQKNIGAFVRIPNPRGSPWSQNNVYHLIKTALEDREKICGSETPTLYGMGISAGAGSLACHAQEFGLEKLLFIAPVDSIGRAEIQEELAQFTGEVYITSGDYDPVAQPKEFASWAMNAKRVEIIEISDCGHQFRGERNGRILSKAPLWAFAGDRSFPSPRGGWKLYGGEDTEREAYARAKRLREQRSNRQRIHRGPIFY